MGCRLPVLPTPLVKAPRLPINQAELQQVIQPFLPEGAKLTIPIRPQSNSAVWPVDLDGTGTANGALAFYKMTDTNMELGVLILEKFGDQWRLRDHIKEIGRDFDYALFADLNGDRAPELLLGCSGGTKGTTAGMNNDLTIYTKQSGKLVGGQRIPYIDIAMGDLTGDQRLEIAIMRRSEQKSYMTLVTVYHYVDGSAKEAALFELDGYPSSLTIGGAAQDRQGLFVELGMGAHSAKTVLVIPENGLWQRLFEGLDAPTFKAYPLGSGDLNGDGIVEIGKQVAPPGTEKLAMVQIPWYEEWFQWDGQKGL
ncbi:MAG: VCBS repeat-containing protein, partial [Bacillota bacterium]